MGHLKPEGCGVVTGHTIQAVTSGWFDRDHPSVPNRQFLKRVQLNAAKGVKSWE